jgi:hypothetical protein
MTLGPWPRSAPLVQGSNTWSPVYEQWLSRLRDEVNGPSLLTFATLPNPATVGQLAVVSDSNTNVWGTVIAGGGAFQVLAWWNGTAWSVVGS